MDMWAPKSGIQDPSLMRDGGHGYRMSTDCTNSPRVTPGVRTSQVMTSRARVAPCGTSIPEPEIW
jgi:hypothetical protein